MHFYCFVFALIHGRIDEGNRAQLQPPPLEYEHDDDIICCIRAKYPKTFARPTLGKTAMARKILKTVLTAKTCEMVDLSIEDFGPPRPPPPLWKTSTLIHSLASHIIKSNKIRKGCFRRK